MLDGSFGGSKMANAALDEGLTLTPFRRVNVGVPGFELLTDALFTTRPDYTQSTPQAIGSLPAPNVIPLPNRAKFEAVVAEWLEDIEFDSLPDEMKGHETFREIVGEGSRVVPLIASTLRKSPSFLFLALEEILGEDPVPEEAYGNLDTTVASWLQWLQR